MPNSLLILVLNSKSFSSCNKRSACWASNSHKYKILKYKSKPYNYYRLCNNKFSSFWRV